MLALRPVDNGAQTCLELVSLRCLPHQGRAFAMGHQLAVLVEGAVREDDDALAGPGLALAHLQHFRWPTYSTAEFGPPHGRNRADAQRLVHANRVDD